MEIKLRYELYNADGSSFTPTRCEQICDVFDMTTKYGDSIISYRQLQELAFENNVFGAIGFDHTASAIRTIFPILKKLGLIVDYEMIKDKSPFELRDLMVKGDDIISDNPNINIEHVDTLLDNILKWTALNPKKNNKSDLLLFAKKLINSKRGFYLED